MLKSFAIIIGLFGGALPAFACDMAIESRSDYLPTYIETGRECLAEPPVPFRFDLQMETLFLSKINDERLSEGLQPLKLRENSVPAARFHSLDFASNNFFDHVGPDGRDSGDRIAAFDRTLLAQKTGENIAQFGPALCQDQYGKEVSCLIAPGFELPSPAMVVDDLHSKLMLSDGHRANILEPNYTHVAIGVAREDTGFYVTQVFSHVLWELPSSLPVALDAQETIRVKVKVDDWDDHALIAITEDDQRVELERGKLGPVPNGTNALIVRLNRTSTEKNGFRTTTMLEWLELFGPAFVVRAPKES